MTRFMPTEEELRARFVEANDELESKREAAAPARQAYENKRSDIARIEREELGPMIEVMQTAESGIYELQQEIATISRALGGKTG